MPEPSSISEIPKVLIDRVENERPLVGFSVRKIKKTGSSFHILDNEEHKGVVRNGEMSASSMAIWEFLHTYAQTLFPADVSQRLFGAWGKPQVAPILQKGEENRVYYKDGKASAYSQMVGWDTERLSELWNIRDAVLPYFYHSRLFKTPRWLGSTSYHLANDLFLAVPALDPNHEIVEHIEHLWEEFSQLNQETISSYMLEQKDLIRGDMDREETHHCSLKLVEASHHLVGKLVKIYRDLEQSGQDIMLENISVKNTLLMLIHLYQTLAQEFELWWLGVTHGHLHLANTVSRHSVQGSREEQTSPLVTTIIDFDAAEISPDILASNDELFASIKGAVVKEKILDTSLDSHVRFQLLFYLPLEQWDENIVQFARTKMEVWPFLTVKLLRLIALRAGKDVHTIEHFTWFTDFVYDLESEKQTKIYPCFDLTLRMLTGHEDLISQDAKDLKVVAQYNQTGVFPSSVEDPLTQQQRLLLLSAIYIRYKGTDSEKELKFTLDELQFIVSQLEKKDTPSMHALRALRGMFDNSEGETAPALFVAARDGDAERARLTKEIVYHIFIEDNQHWRSQKAQIRLIETLERTNCLEFVIRLLDLQSKPRNEAYLVYKHLRNEIDTGYAFREKPQEKVKYLVQLDKRAEEEFGRLFMLGQRIKEKLIQKH